MASASAEPAAEQEEFPVLRSYFHYLSFLRTNNIDDLQEAVRCTQEVVDVTPPDVPRRALILQCLARRLVQRFHHARQKEDATRAVDMFHQAVLVMTDNNPVPNTRIDCYGLAYILRECKSEGPVTRYGVQLCVPLTGKSNLCHVEVLTPKVDEGDEVFNYFLQSTRGKALPLEASLEDLEYEIRGYRQALEVFCAPRPNPEKFQILSLHLGYLLNQRFTKQGRREDIDEAIDCLCITVDLQMPMEMRMLDTHNCCLFLAGLLFINRYKRFRGREDLDSAVNYVKQGMELCHSKGSDFAEHSAIVAEVMFRRFETTGNAKDLDIGIEESLRAVHAAQRGHFNLHFILISFTYCLEKRYMMTGHTKDITHAIEIAQRALDVCPHEHPKREECLLRLSHLENLLGFRLQDSEYFERGFKHLQEARVNTLNHPQGDVGFSFQFLETLGRQQLLTGQLDEAIETMRMLTRKCTDIRIAKERPWDSILGTSLEMKWRNTREIELLNEAIVVARRRVESHRESKATDIGDLITAQTLLGRCLHHRHKITGVKEDQENAEAILLEGFQNSKGEPVGRIAAALPLIDILSDLQDWDRARHVSQEIVDLTVMANGRFLDCTDKQPLLQMLSLQISTFASIALEAGSDIFDVIDMLETLRGSILGQMIDIRTDLDDLKAVAPDIAERFAALRDDANSEISSRTSANMDVRIQEVTSRVRAEVEMRACLVEIRNLEGFHRFLLGPTRSELKEAAAEGPIIFVNITPIRSDAIIVTHNTYDLLSLPDLDFKTMAKFQEVGHVNFSDITVSDLCAKNSTCRKVLECLWVNCVKLIFQKLDDLIPSTAKFCVWWIGIGIASSLPFHAAGIYTRKVCESALFRTISSYTPTLKFLIHSRQKLRKSPRDADVDSQPSKPEMVIVTMPTTGGKQELDLPGVQEEGERIQKVVEASFSAQHSLQPCAKEVMESMKKCQVVHFACHGRSMLKDPLSSHLLLQTSNPDSGTPIIDKLTVRDVASLNLSHSKLAVLSACSTAQNRDRSLQDEVLHLAAGFRVAGYLHTVGNLWPADDDVSLQVMERFYQHLIEAGELGNGENVGKALNEALIDVLADTWKQPLSWVSFVHFGI